MAAKVIAFANRKGGVGKSTMTRDVASYLAIQGSNVLIVDTDPQGTLGAAFGLPADDGLYRLMVKGESWPNVALAVNASQYTTPDHPAQGNLFIVCSDNQTAAIPVTVRNPMRLRKRIDEVRSRFDYILIDTAPTITMLDGAIFSAVDGFVFVTECEKWALDGVRAGIAEIEEFTVMPVNLVGIIPNKVTNTVDHDENLAALHQMYDQFVWDPVPKRTLISEPGNYGLSVFAYRPGSTEAGIMAAIGQRFQKEVARV